MNYLIDPENITDFSCSRQSLELHILFWICAAGKKASVAARNLQRLLEKGNCKFNTSGPFEIIRGFGQDLPYELKSHGIGCYNNKARSMLDLVGKEIDLKTCSVLDLESVIGIGPKTARCFLIHTRKDVRHAGLDTHVLKYMRDNGVDVPKSTPGGRKYLELEAKFLQMADKSGKSISEFDLEIWRYYSSKKTNLSHVS